MSSGPNIKEDPSMPNGFFHCPKGHALPNVTSQGECTPTLCVGERDDELTRGASLPQQRLKPLQHAKKVARAAAMKAARKVDEKLDSIIVRGDVPKEEAVAARMAAKVESVDERARHAIAVARNLARKELMDGPACPLEGVDAEEWAQRRLMQLVPDAVLEVEYQLKYAGEDQRYDAALEVLDRTGFNKSDKGASGAGPVIILTGAAMVNPPWQQKPKASAPEIIDGKVLTEKK